jgi:putative transposon-encoded protein
MRGKARFKVIEYTKKNIEQNVPCVVESVVISHGFNANVPVPLRMAGKKVLVKVIEDEKQNKD